MYTEFSYQDFLSAPRETNVSYNGFLRRATILKCAETKKVPLSRQIIQLSIFCLSINFININRMRRFTPHRLKLRKSFFHFANYLTLNPRYLNLRNAEYLCDLALSLILEISQHDNCLFPSRQRLYKIF